VKKETQIKVVAAVGAIAAVWISLARSPQTGWVLVSGALLALCGLWLSFANALSLLLLNRVLIQIYRGTEMDTREEYMKRPIGKVACILSPLSFGTFFLVALNLP